MSLFDPLTPEERKRINDIRSGEIIDATPAHLQSLLDYMIGKKVVSFSDSLTRGSYGSEIIYDDYAYMIASGSIVLHGIEITLGWKWKMRIPSNQKLFDQGWSDYWNIRPKKVLIQFPNGDLNLRPLTYEHNGQYVAYQLRGPIRTGILRHINKWKKREGF